MDVFVSYSRLDEKIAEDICVVLRRHGHTVWFDKDSLLPGQIWDREIGIALKKSDLALLLLSTNSVAF